MFETWRGRQLAPTVTALRSHVLGLAQAEATRIAAAMPSLGERERRALSDLADGIAKIAGQLWLARALVCQRALQ